MKKELLSKENEETVRQGAKDETAWREYCYFAHTNITPWRGEEHNCDASPSV